MSYFTLSMILYFILFPILLIGQTNQTADSKTFRSHGLIFEKESVTRLADSSYSDIIQLRNLGDKAQALQFRLQMNKAIDDSTILVFKDISRGSDIIDPSWLLDYNVIKGPLASNGASEDEIFVVLYNLNQDGGLLPGNYDNLFIVEYKVAGLQKSGKEIKSSIKISDAVASTFQGFAIDVTPSLAEYKITAKRK